MSKESVERWAFTRREMDNLEKAKTATRDDEFIAYVDGHGIIVDRRGKCLNRYDDGTRGVPKATKNAAENTSSIYRTHGGELADTWVDVITNEEGEFVHFDFIKHTPRTKYWS